MSQRPLRGVLIAAILLFLLVVALLVVGLAWKVVSGRS